MAKMSETCKTTMIEEFGFNNSELIAIEDFMNNSNNMTARDILYSLIENSKLNIKQKIIISYIVGNSAAHTSDILPKPVLKDIDIDIHSNMPHYGG